MATRLSHGERREQILAATQRLVARRGFTSVTLREVAGEVGVAHGLIRHYFATREALVAAAFDAAVTAELANDEELAEHAEPVGALADWLTATPREHYLVWIDAWSEAPRNADLHAALTRHHRDCERRLARIVERLADAGLARTTAPTTDAHELTALMDGMAVQLHVLGTVDRAAADRLVFDAAERRVGLAHGSLAAPASRGTRGQWMAAAPG